MTELLSEVGKPSYYLMPDYTTWYSEPSLWKSAKIGELGAIVVDADDLHQCIRTILLTPRGSLALEPEFASDLFDHVDKPLDVARPLVVRDTIDAIARWEPRIDVQSVAVTIPEFARLQVDVVWVVRDSAFVAQTEVLL